MAYEQQMPFYMAYPFLIPFQQEQDQERELQVMKSYYSPKVLEIQQKVECECDRMEYDGSMMFDEYPDKFMVEHICRKIEKELDEEGRENLISDEYQEEWKRYGKDRDLIGVLLFNEHGAYRTGCQEGSSVRSGKDGRRYRCLWR